MYIKTIVSIYGQLEFHHCKNLRFENFGKSKLKMVSPGLHLGVLHRSLNIVIHLKKVDLYFLICNNLGKYIPTFVKLRDEKY